MASPRSLVAQGAGLAEEYCGTCHAVGRTGESKVAGAPAFRTLSARYPIDNLAESFAEGLQVGHDGMPEFRFEPNEVRAMLAYLESIQPAR
jgi:mono/diheme cytochrome c family protein